MLFQSGRLTFLTHFGKKISPAAAFLLSIVMLLTSTNASASLKTNNLAEYKVISQKGILSSSIKNGFFKVDEKNKVVLALDNDRHIVGKMPLVTVNENKIYELTPTLSADNKQLSLKTDTAHFKLLPKEVSIALKNIVKAQKPKPAPKPAKPGAKPKKNIKKATPKQSAPKKPTRYIPTTEQFWNALDNVTNLLNKKGPLDQALVYGSASIGGSLGASIGQWGSLISVPFVLLPIIGPLIFFPMASISLLSAFTMLGAFVGSGLGAQVGASLTLDPQLNAATQNLFNKIVEYNTVGSYPVFS